MSTTPYLVPNNRAIYPDLQGKVVLLTGIGQIAAPNSKSFGNGAASAIFLAYQGCKIVGCDLDIEPARITQKKILDSGGVCDVLSADVTVKEDVKKLVEYCLEKHGRIDILVNNVGRSTPGGPADLSEEEWDAQIDVNLKSVYLCCHLVLPMMEKQKSGGSIVNMSSVAGLRYTGKPQVAYASAKAGVIQFTKTTGVIYARRGVRMNVVVPGLMHTPLVEMLADKYAGGDLEGYVQTRHEQVPMGKMGDAWDIASAVAFLASDSSRYMTGQKIVVDGGITSSTGRT